MASDAEHHHRQAAAAAERPDMPPYSVFDAIALRAEVTAIRQILECALTGLYTADELERLAKGSLKMADEFASQFQTLAAISARAAARIYENAAKSPLHQQIADRAELIAAKPEGSA
jgi:hypothetical protein